MAFSPDELLNELNGPAIIDWALELKFREEALVFLLDAVKGDLLNENQYRNALHMLYRMAFPENVDSVFQALIGAFSRSDMEIRSEAVQLAVGMVRLSKNLRQSVDFSPGQKKLLLSAVEQGLTEKVGKLVENYLES